MNFTHCIYSVLLCLGLSLSLQAQPLQKSMQGPFVLTNATLVTVTNGTMQGSLVIEGDRITDMGEEVDIPAGATTIDCRGLTIYPGMIDGGTHLGLSEVGSISLTQDYRELGDVVPHMQTLTAVNPNSVAIPVTRVNGVTTVIAEPSGSLFTGTASLIHLHGYTPEQMYAGFKAVCFDFPSTGRRGWYDRRSEEEIKKANDRAFERVNETWEKAVQYAKLEDAYREGKADEPHYYPELAALTPIVRGEAKMMIEVDRAADILKAIEWVQEKEVDAIFTSVAEGWRVAEELAEAGIPVLAGPVLDNPSRDSDRYDRPYANPGIMQQAGVKVALRTGETENVRNLPYHAGFAAAYGMGQEEALKAVTIVPAEIFGLEKELGSLEVGKIANLFVTDGDPFETRTQVKHVFIKGWQVPMDSRHIRLYNEFLERTPGLRR